MNKLITTAALALAGAALLQTSASATPIGDLILGFQTGSTGDTGGTTNVMVDLGASTIFTADALADTGTTINLSNDFSVSDLSSYGSSPTDLFFGVIGENGTTGATRDVFVTSSTNTAFSNEPNSALASALSLVYGGTGISDGTAGTGTAFVDSSANSGSYSTLVKNTAGTFNNATFNSGTTAAYNPSGSVILDLYEDLNSSSGSATFLGTLTLTGGTTDSLIYTAPNAAPEPSTYALFGISALAMILAIRRRNALKA